MKGLREGYLISSATRVGRKRGTRSTRIPDGLSTVPRRTRSDTGRQPVRLDLTFARFWGANSKAGLVKQEPRSVEQRVEHREYHGRSGGPLQSRRKLLRRVRFRGAGNDPDRCHEGDRCDLVLRRVLQ